MAENKTTQLGDLMKQAQGVLALNPMMVPQMAEFWKAQDRILDEAEAYSRAWFERRHEAARSALDVARDVAGKGGANSPGALGAITEWQRGSMERMAEDFRQWNEFCTRCTSLLARAETEAAKEGVEEVEKLAATTGKAKHTTPV